MQNSRNPVPPARLIGLLVFLIPCNFVFVVTPPVFGQDSPAPASAVPSGVDVSKLPPEVQQQMRERMKRAGRTGPPTAVRPTPEGSKDNKKPESNKKPEAKSGDAKANAPGVVKRPDKPTQLANPEELNVRPDPEGLVQFSFQGQPWPAVVEWLGIISGMAIDWRELPSGYLNLWTHRKYTLEETRDLINRHLLARGYTILQDGEFLTVEKVEGMNTGLVPRVTPEQLASRMPYEFVKVSFKLDWMVAEEAVKELEPMLSKNGKLTSLSTTNRIEAIDTVKNLQQIYDVIQQEQSDESHQGLVREFTLRHVRASVVRKKMEELLGIESSKKDEAPQGSPQQRAQQQAMRIRMAQQAQRNAQKNANAAQKPKEEEKISFIVNDQKNSLIAFAPPDKMAIIEETVLLLDVPSDQANSLDAYLARIKTYHLVTLNPQEVVDILMETGGLDPSTRLTVDEQSKAILVNGPPWDHMTIGKLIDKLDGSAREFRVERLRRRPADQVAATISTLMIGPKEESNNRLPYYLRGYRNNDDEKKDEFRVSADVERNWLLLWCNDSEYQDVLKFLAELGELPSENGNPSQVRVIDDLPAEEIDRLLERVSEAFRAVAPNQVQLPRRRQPKNDPNEEEGSESESDDTRRTPPIRNPTEARATPTTPIPNGIDRNAMSRIPIHLAQLTAERPAADRGTDTGLTDNQSPPINISRGPDGQLIIQSLDTHALDLFEELMAKMAPPVKDYHVFTLKYASASWVSLTLEEFFAEEEEDDNQNRWPFIIFSPNRDDSEPTPLGLSDRRPLKFVSEVDSNTIIVRNATARQLATIAELIDIYDIPEPVNSQAARFTRLVHLKHSKASLVAATIKDAFRDLLSGNDKVFQQRNNQGERNQRPGGSMMRGFGGGDSGRDNQDSNSAKANFKGKLSMGIDDVTNTLLISTEGETLMSIVVRMVEELDTAAKQADDVQIVKLESNANASNVQAILSQILGQDGDKAPSQGQTENDNRPGDGPEGERPTQRPPANNGRRGQ